jgi:hypothetical protein
MAKKAAKNRQEGKREDGYAREPNGQLSRKKVDMINRAFSQYDAEERATLETGLAARERVHGLSRVQEGPKGQPVAVSRDPMAGSFIGRLCMTREITVTQYDAAMQWQKDWLAYMQAIEAPPQPGAVDLNRTHGSGGIGEYENVDWVKGSIQSYRNAHKAVQQAQYEASNGLGCHFSLLGTLWHLVQQDIERMDMVPDLRQALNVLARHYKLESARKAA